MRCVNCGYDNEPSRDVCLKCGSHLYPDEGYDYLQRNDSNYGVQEPRQTVVFSGDTPPNGGSQLKKTIAQDQEAPQASAAYGPKATVAQDAPMQNAPELCPRCHYLMSGNFCANCGYEYRDAAAPAAETPVAGDKVEIDPQWLKSRHNTCTKCGAEVPADFKYCPYCAEPIIPVTVNPFAEKADEPAVEATTVVTHRFSLTPLDGNGHDLPDVRTLEFKEPSMILNRDNTAPGKLTITSKEQAEIRCDEGRWELKNCSEYNSTFVAACRPLELLSGDIILLGDQRFRFNPIDDAGQ